jgi:hypothetical protein
MEWLNINGTDYYFPVKGSLWVSDVFTTQTATAADELTVNTETTTISISKIVNSPIDTALSATSTNPVQNKVVYAGIKAHTEATANAHPATAISVDTSEFGGNLDETVNTVQKLATAVDELEASPVITEPLTPSNDAVAVGDGFQEIGEKVAGLQDKLVYSDILTENANPVEITQDRFGNPLALTDFYLYVYHPAYSAASGLQLTVNDLQTGYDFRNAINSNNIILYQSSSLVYSFHHIKFKLITFITGIAESLYCLDVSQSNFYSQFAIPAVTEVNKISITATGVRTLPIGIKIEIYRI